mmetsp:Transcript_16244/g.52879  ORF Transcript_16244/g.52879 Transcript_16244/m.52879 type:complete len:427 (-) Transcript_16244:164-1444(-)
MFSLEEIEARRRTLSATPPRPSRKTLEESSSPVYARVKLRKTGRQLTGRLPSLQQGKEEEPSSWFAWLFSTPTRCGSCFPGGTTAAAKEEEVAVQRARISKERAPSCASCGERIYGAQERFDDPDDGKAYHRSCLRCAKCRTSLASASRSQRRLLICATCAHKAEDARRRSDPSAYVVGASALEAGTRKGPDAKGDVRGVLDAIGDELEEAYRATIPACDVCGGAFEKGDDIRYEIQQDKRIPKAHAECARLGRPRDGRIHSAQPPRIAAKKVDAHLVVKATDATTSRTVTLFFDQKGLTDDTPKKHHSKAENDAPATVRYSYARPNDETPSARLRRETTLRSALLSLFSSTNNSEAAITANVKVAADPAFQGKHIQEDVHAATITLQLQATKARLLHTLALSFHVDHLHDRAEPIAADLTISRPI